MKPKLTEQDYVKAARKLNCEVAAIKAVAEVESRSSGFLDTDEPVILFERHKFSQFTKGLFDSSHPGISNPEPGGYGALSKQHKRLQEAVALDRNAALMSASWGKFQIMGFNFTLAGFNSLQHFVTAMYTSEAEHLKAFVNYLDNTFLDEVLRKKDWKEFARRYNGKTYYKNKYDQKLKAAYKKYS